MKYYIIVQQLTNYVVYFEGQYWNSFYDEDQDNWGLFKNCAKRYPTRNAAEIEMQARPTWFVNAYINEVIDE